MADKRKKHTVGKPERVMNLLAFLLERREPVPWFAIHENVEGYSPPDEGASREGVVSESAATYAVQRTEQAAEKRFARDRKLLRDTGIEILYEHPGGGNPGGYYVSRDDCFLPRLNLTPQERALLWRLQNTATASGFSPLFAPLLSALQKLLFEESAGEEAQDGDGVVCYLEGRSDRVVEENFSLLNEAVGKGRVVTFHYHSIGRDTMEERVVAPYALGAYAGRWYLVGQCMIKQAIRLFRLDRIVTRVSIRDSASEGPDFSLPADFDIHNYLGRRAWAMGRAEAGKAFKAEVRFDGETGRYVAELLRGSAECRLKPDGECIATFTITREEPFIRWLMKFGRHAKILSPHSLVRDFEATVRAVKDSYSDERDDA
ncbi:MAG: WYL domain-containing protein [Planctomycetota bacterium]